MYTLEEAKKRFNSDDKVIVKYNYMDEYSSRRTTCYLSNIDVLFNDDNVSHIEIIGKA